MAPVDHELARAKLTRNLRVAGRRGDGYHLVESEMVTLDLADELELSAGEGIEVVGEGPCEGRLLESIAGDNLVERALRLVDRQAHVRLRKRIPPGAGLGGGSADAAAVLRWAGVSDAETAATLGADVPFCLLGGRAAVSGIGEVVHPLPPVDLFFVLVLADLAVSTAAVYSAFDNVDRSSSETETTNDLETAALRVAPELGRIRELLAETTHREPHLAGSGAAWFVECGADESAPIATALREALAKAGLSARVVEARTEG